MQRTEKANSRSAIMRAVKDKNTKPELLVRRLAHKIAPGYRLHRKDLPGKPDLIWIARKRVVFVHGCFWHGHDCPRGSRVPKTNRDYWLAKIARNKERDEASLISLQARGFSALTIWECELLDPDAVSDRLRSFLH
jgi:DNA mismatch endonuclease, patch repair protein